MNRIYLRQINEADSEMIVRWRNTTYVRSHSLYKQPISVESHLNHYYNNVCTGKYKQFIVEKIDCSGVVIYPIATVYLKDVDYENNRCELCVFTSSDNDWDESCQTEGIKLLIEKAFNEYGMHKIYSYVFCKHPNEIRILEEAGFKIEACLEVETLNIDGTAYESIYRMSIINNPI